jgi:GT2 family glycosyltransferase
MQCIGSLYQTRGVSIEIILVDNCSQDDTLKRVKTKFPSVKIIANNVNKGFAAAVNQGAFSCTGEKILIINPDAVIIGGSVRRMYDFININKKIGVLGCKILDSNYSIQFSARGFPDYMTPFFGRRALWSKLIPLNPITNRNLAAAHLMKKPEPVDWVSGAVMMVPAALFKGTGGFDQRFFMYWEDADFCLRLKKLGYLTYYFPQARAVHFTGCSSRKRHLLSSCNFYISAFKYYYKNIRVPCVWSLFTDIAALIGLFIFLLYGFVKASVNFIKNI